MADELSAEETAAAEAAAAEETAAAEKAAEEATAVAEKAAAEKATEADWRDLLTSDEAKKQAKQFNSLEEVFERSAELRKQISDRIKLPGKDADEKEMTKFRKAMGIPESADDYTFDLPDGMKIDEAEQALLDAVKPIAHEANVPAKVLSAFIVGFKELEAQFVGEHTAQLEKHREASEDENRKEWGNDYEPNVNLGNRFVKQFGGDGMVEFLNTTELKNGGVLGNDPQMVRLFAKLGRQMSEDGVFESMGKDEAADIEGQIDELTQKAMTALNSGDKMLADKLYAQRSDLSVKLYGDEPIGGAGMAA